jgi:hypothetical protein
MDNWFGQTDRLAEFSVRRNWTPPHMVTSVVGDPVPGQEAAPRLSPHVGRWSAPPLRGLPGSCRIVRAYGALEIWQVFGVARAH